jgi:hypothetical protein
MELHLSPVRAPTLAHTRHETSPAPSTSLYLLPKPRRIRIRRLGRMGGVAERGIASDLQLRFIHKFVHGDHSTYGI